MGKNAKDKPVGKKEQSNTKTESSNLFASRLCYSMEIRQMSVCELADALYVSTSTVSAYRTGRRLPSIQTLSAIANILHFSTDYLLGLTDYPDMVCGRLPRQDEQFLSLFHTIDETTRSSALVILRQLQASNPASKS